MKMLFSFVSKNIKISEINVCKLIIMHDFARPLKKFSLFSRFISFFLENLRKAIKKINKVAKIMGQIRGENIGGGRKNLKWRP